MPHHGVEVLHLKDARCNKHTPNSKAITSSALLSYDQQLANNKRRLTAKDKFKVQMMQGHQSTGILCDGGYIPYLRCFSDNLDYRVPIVPFLCFSLHTQSLERWKCTPKQNKREAQEFCTDIGDRYLPPPRSGDHLSHVGGVVDFSYQLQPPRARCGVPKMTDRTMRRILLPGPFVIVRCTGSCIVGR